MLPLKELYERVLELKAKERLYSEEAAELSDLTDKIVLREKYLMRYVNHYPHADNVITAALEKFAGREVNDTLKDEMRTVISNIIHSWVASLAVSCKFDGEDLIFMFSKEVNVHD